MFTKVIRFIIHDQNIKILEIFLYNSMENSNKENRDMHGRNFVYKNMENRHKENRDMHGKY